MTIPTNAPNRMKRMAKSQRSGNLRIFFVTRLPTADKILFFADFLGSALFAAPGPKGIGPPLGLYRAAGVV